MNKVSFELMQNIRDTLNEIVDEQPDSDMGTPEIDDDFKGYLETLADCGYSKPELRIAGAIVLMESTVRYKWDEFDQPWRWRVNGYDKN